MAAKGSSSVQVQKNLEGFIGILTSAACEWFLIFLLLVDGLFSYLLTKFAAYCNLQKPCIFCSRFEHVLGNEKPQLYQDLLCSNHLSELSSWIACQIYGKHDGKGKSGGCHLSIPKKDKSNPEKHMFSVGKSGLDLGSSGVKSAMHNRNSDPTSVGVKPCSFCSRPCRPRASGQGVKLKSSGDKPNIPLPRYSSRSRSHRRDGSKKVRDKFSASVSTRRPVKIGWDPLAHGGYTELKMSSDTDSVCRPGKMGWAPLPHVGYTELKISSDTDFARRPGKIGWDPLSHVGYTELKISSDTDSEFPLSDEDDGSSIIIGHHDHKKESVMAQCASKNNPFKAPPNNVSNKHKPSLSDPCVQPDGKKAFDVQFLDSNVASENGLGETNWQQANQKSNPSALPELISLDDIFPSSNAVEKNVTGTSDFGHESINKNDELLKSLTATDAACIKTDPIVNLATLVNPNPINVDVVPESAGTLKEGDSSGIIKEQPTVKEPDKVDGELKPLDSQNSSAPGSNISPNNTISGATGCGDEKQVADASNSNPKPVLKTSASVESGLESLDEGYVSEIEGESIVDRLKRQVEYYRKSIQELYKELEEERNASAIAANQAMAMITKLQEEKAAIHMEALQYLRMMEEQAEFDVDALEKANDLLAEKEKEIQDLEAELEFTKIDIPDELTMENTPEESCDLESTVMPSVKSDVYADVTSNSTVTEIPKTSKERLFSETTLLEFEDEKLYISNCLKSLERKLSEISCNGASSNMPNGGTPRKEMMLLNGQIGENAVHTPKGLHVSNGSSAAQEGSDSLDSEENKDSESHGQKDFMDKETELLILENEISDLNDRLEALETDHDFLEHMLYSLQNGGEGLQFVQEIAQQLRELRKIGTAFRTQSVA